MHVPITVYEDAGVPRTGEGVTLGIPLPREAGIRDVRALRVVDESGAEVLAQLRPLARWDAPPSDGRAPLRWVLADFRAAVAANARRTYELVETAGAAAQPSGDRGDLARAEEAVVRVDTTAVTATFSRAAPGPLRLVASAPGSEEEALAKATEVELEENGPLRACVRVRGVLEEGFEEKGGRHPLRWTMRWHFTAGSALARVQVTIENPDRPHEKPFNDRGEPVGKRLGRLALELDAPGPAITAGVAPAEGTLVVRQDAEGSEIRRGKKAVEKGTRAPGWIAAGGKAIGMRSFAENHPKALVARGGTLALELFPRGEDVFFQGARAKTHDVWVRLGGAAPGSPETIAVAAMRPLRAAVEPRWLQQTGALGPLSVEDPRRWPAFERTLDRVVAADLAPTDGTIFDERRASRATGWLDYGDSFRDARDGARRFGNAEFDFGWVLLRQYLREPDHDRVWLEQAEAVLRHVMDIDVLHTRDDAPWANGGVRKHDGGEFTGHSRGPDFSHFWVRGLLAFHLVTGDARAKEVAVEQLGGWIERREERGRPGWLVHADELRDVGWVLVALADLHDATGDPRWLALSRRIARTMVVPGVDADGRMLGAPFLNRRDSFMPWQQAYVADGLGRLCLTLRAQGKRDALLEKTLRRMLDFLAGPAWIEEPRTIHGETYPRMVASSIDAGGKRDAGDGAMSQTLADPMVWGWLLFGQEKYRSAAREATRHTFPEGPKRYYDPSIATPAKNAAVRTYFGEAARWMEQTAPAPLATGELLEPDDLDRVSGEDGRPTSPP